MERTERPYLLQTEDPRARERPLTATVLARLDHPAAVGLIGFLGWLGFVLARWQIWAKGQISYFIMVGHCCENAAQLPPHIGQVPQGGYDGQFYYRLALNPFNWSPSAYGIRMDQPYRYTRIGYPLLTWLLSAGQHVLVPVVLVAVNVLAVTAMGVLGALFARESGRHALWGLLLIAYCGMVVSVGRDTSEPLADACMLGGMLAYRHSRYVIAALLLGYGAAVNDPVLAVPAAIAVTRLYAMYRRRARPGVQDLSWLLPGVVWVILEVAERLIVKGMSGGAADVRRNISWPFAGMIRALAADLRGMSWTHLGRYDFNLIEYILLVVVVAAGFLVLARTAAPPWERIAFVFFVVIELVMASWQQIWSSVFSDGRPMAEAYVLAMILVLATPKIRLPTRYLGALTAVVLAVLIVVARRRILFE